MSPYSLPASDLVFYQYANLDSRGPQRFLLVGNGMPAQIVFGHISDRGHAVGWADGNKLIGALHYSPFTWLLNINSTIIYDDRILGVFAGQALNMHPAPLPEYSGLHCHYWAIKHHKKEWAATVHFMDMGIDTGDIAAVRVIPIEEADTPQSLFIKTMVAGAKLMCHVVDDILSGKPLARHPQDLSKRRVYTRRMAAADGWQPAIDELTR